MNYTDTGWQPAVACSSQAWGHLTARRIPLLREKFVPYTFAGNAKLPVTLHAGQKLEFDAGRMVQAYPVLELSADEGAEIKLEPFGVKYIAKAGAQSHFTIDSCGVMRGAIVCTPEPGMLKLMVSAPGLAFASRIACRKVPGPLLAVLVTVKVAPKAADWAIHIRVQQIAIFDFIGRSRLTR